MTTAHRLFPATAASTCRFFSRKSAACPFQLQSVMLQSRVLQHYSCPYLQNSAFCIGRKYEKCFQMRLRKLNVSCVIKSNQPGVISAGSPTSRNSDGCRLAITSQPQFKLGHSCIMMPLNFAGYGLISPYPGKRYFSHIQGPIMKKNDGVGVIDGRISGITSGFKVSNKDGKQAKSLAAYKRTVAGRVRVAASTRALGMNYPKAKKSAIKDPNMVSSNKQLVGEGKDDASSVSSLPVGINNQVSKVRGNQKRQSRSKKSNEQCSGTNSASDAAAQTGGSVRVSQAKTSKSAKKNQPSASAKNNLIGETPIEEPDSSISTKQQSVRTVEKSRRKGKSTKEANSIVKAPVPQASSGNDLVQKQENPTGGKSKPRGQRKLPVLQPPKGKSVVVVESATKAKVIQGYLGDMFEVLPSYGHVRDLAARSGSVRPDNDFSMIWEVSSAASTHLKSIKVALSGAENLILASDPDREGEAIAWHIIEILQQEDALREDMTVARVVFNEITESSVKSALQAPRDIDVNLVHAYLARRALDYLIGFNISPLLWRKLPGCQSAGRVQSAALSIICDREKDIDEFKSQEYWTVEVEFNISDLGSVTSEFSFSSYLTHFNSEKLNQLSVSSHAEAKDIEEKINSSNFEVVELERKKIRKNPLPPFITSTLQQEAANKLHFSATSTMRLAQKLYEGVQLSNGTAAGLITYMRTDGLHISDEAAKDIRSLVIDRYGDDFATQRAHKYLKKVKNAQEAHEAIRPTDIRRLPSQLVGILDEDSLKLYTLIWARTMASQIKSATIDQIQVDIGNADQSIALRSTCSKVGFLGYLAAYEDIEAKTIRSNANGEYDRIETFKVLDNLRRGDSLYLGEVELTQHHTQPPPRYNEGSLVKKLEELGIGRPSTYASTIKVLKDRNYVTVKSRVLYPQFRGRMVSAFLSHHFSEVTNYSFTADMESELDNISTGSTEWKGLLGDYWTRFRKYCDLAASVHIHQVEKMLENTFGDLVFASLPDKSRTCPSCLEGTLIFKVSRFGAGYFLGCDKHPQCKFIAKTLYRDDNEEVTSQNNPTAVEPKLIGLHPGSNDKILLKKGPYGFYLQLGEDSKGCVPKRASVSQVKDVDSITLEVAIELLRYPVMLGNHPDSRQPVMLKLARFGFSIGHQRTSVSIPKEIMPGDITLEKALELLLTKKVKGRRQPKSKPKSKPKLKEAIKAV
ncbi:uncharacterized protein LOC131326515 isoform X1 [Rhododendron vialii]|uniref:uncharacterized protein LOC131326515 isoform X1 n=2 Tax=Rhododendron vialii TaxID=182163 RepID=UPI002660052B|nr:uncharacterized protein LOC131326515 isoform X1 [Rhododendron vialii]